MTTTTKAPVLIVGGSGVVGSIAAKFLRRLHPDLPIAIGGRDFHKARAVADELGNADAVVVDLGRADLGQPAERAFSAVVMFLKDDTLHSLEFAQARGVPYLEISTAAFELAPLVGLYVARPKSAPILLDGYWLAGAATLAAVQLAREFRSVESIELAAVLDEQDVGGPAAYADLERQTKAVTSALQLIDGQWKWVGGEAGGRVFKAVDGRELTGQGYSLLERPEPRHRHRGAIDPQRLRSRRVVQPPARRAVLHRDHPRDHRHPQRRHHRDGAPGAGASAGPGADHRGGRGRRRRAPPRPRRRAAGAARAVPAARHPRARAPARPPDGVRHPDPPRLNHFLKLHERSSFVCPHS
ncbi:NAD(P)-dependent oxidoreductase [Nannocystis pusilla]|uniref:NAD(P)-dependent oxidoreductase n=1 Tax=Nannocystis pusilla TaxID=889268 RepID=UPI003DA3E9AC